MNGNKILTPYNFVRLIESSKSQVQEISDALSGVIKCKITCKTPVFIPNTSNAKSLIDDNEHKSYDYYSYTDNAGKTIAEIARSHPLPVIPASEIRGVVRSVYETFTNSCVSSVNLSDVITARSTDPFLAESNAQAAVLKYVDGGWKLFKATHYKLKHSSDVVVEEIDSGYIYRTAGKEYYNLDEISVYCQTETINGGGLTWRAYAKKTDADQAKYIRYSAGFKNGILVTNARKLNIDFSKSKSAKNSYPSVFVKDNQTISISNDALKGLERIMQEYADPKINKNLKTDDSAKHYGYIGYLDENGELNKEKELPIWIQTKVLGRYSSFTYYTPAQKGRIAYENRLKDYLKSVAPCAEKTKSCPTCQLFGFIGNDKNDSIKSRIKFFDAICSNSDNKEVFDIGSLTLRELSGPKITAVEMYTHSQDNSKRLDFWNFDVAKLGSDEKAVSDLIALNGRKFYWHNQDWKSFASCKEITNRNNTIRPLKEGLEFIFELSFKNISKSELDNLCYALNFGDNSNNNCHKLGMGKPLGLGSIKIAVEEVVVRTISVENGITYQISSYTIDNLPEAVTRNEGAINDLKLITDFDVTKGCTISYPQVDPASDTGYDYFVTNRGNVAKPKFQEVLPVLSCYDRNSGYSLTQQLGLTKLKK